MKIKVFITFLFASLLLAVSCQKEDVKVNSKMDDETLTTVADEVLADINFADLLYEGDDGVFWGDAAFSSFLKSAEIEDACWSKKTKVEEGNKVVVTLEFSGKCGKSGTIIIEYLKPNDKSGVKKKTITYQDFIKNDITFNGTKDIVRGNNNYNINGDMTITKINDAGDEATITRNYEREVHWICGLDTRKDKDDNIMKVTGKAEVTKTIGETEKTYSRKILKPLLIVKTCNLKIQAGSVKIKRGDGTEVTIDYGKMPKNVSCDSKFECGTKFSVTKDGKTYQMELVDGKRVKVTEEK